jgi:hypothetical protein
MNLSGHLIKVAHYTMVCTLVNEIFREIALISLHVDQWLKKLAGKQ